jgi:hypothetical protein
MNTEKRQITANYKESYSTCNGTGTAAQPPKIECGVRYTARMVAGDRIV